MEKITKPKIKLLNSGTKLVAKQMQANAGELLPPHLASDESILFIHEGECKFKMNQKELLLKAGDAIVVPPDVRHQLEANTDFKGIHFMPADIEFKFFE